MEKVKVSKEIFKALESTKAWDVDGCNGINFKKGLIRLKLDDGFQSNRQCLNLMDFEEFMDCLFNGYELEENKLEIISKRIKDFKLNQDGFSEAYVDGALDMLDALNLKIEGVNA